MIFFDPLTLSFIDSRITSVPNSAVEITPKQREKAINDASKPGFKIAADENGMPIAVSVWVEDSGGLLYMAKSELRTMRAPMLDALTGIAGRAARAGNDALAAEADALSVLLLDITDDQALNAATTYEEMQAAGIAAYKRIAATASPELSIVFREITGA